jgi:hypothetical protein
MPWNIRRDFHIDINASYGSFLLQSATDSSLRQPPPDMIAGDGMPVRFHFWERGIAGALIVADPGPDTVFIFSGRPAGAPSGSDLLFVTNDFVEIADGVWEGTLDLTTAEFSAHLVDAVNGSKIILGEVEVRDGIANTKRNSFQFDLTARREVFLADDADPTPLPGPIGATAPVNAVKATASIQFKSSANPAPGTTLTIGSLTYTFVAAATVAGHVLIGADSTATALNFDDAINGAGLNAPGNPDVISTGVGSGPTVYLEAVLPGGAGDDLDVIASDLTQFELYGVLGFSGGQNATPTPPYLRVHGGFLYVPEGSTWKKTALSNL